MNPSEQSPAYDLKDLAAREAMQGIAQAVKEKIPAGFGFFVLVASPGDNGRANYVSNLARETALKVMKEFIIRNGAEEEWMKHL